MSEEIKQYYLIQQHGQPLYYIVMCIAFGKSKWKYVSPSDYLESPEPGPGFPISQVLAYFVYDIGGIDDHHCLNIP